MRIGQWPTKTTLAPSVVPEAHSSIRRIGTDPVNEELSVGVVRSRTCPNDGGQPENDAARETPPHDTEHCVATQAQGSVLSYDYYQLEWFWILIGTILLMVSETVIWFLVTFGDFAIIILPIPVLISIAIGLVSSMHYIGVFFILMEHHEEIESAIYKYTRLRPGSQNLCLRVCAYAYACGVIVAFALQIKFSLDIMFST